MKTLIKLSLILSIYMLNSLPTEAQTWQEDKKITSDPKLRKQLNTFSRDAFDEFGYNLAMDGNFAVVGCYSKEFDTTGINGVNAGTVYVYKLDSGRWKIYQKLMQNPILRGDEFGSRVAIHKDYIFVSSLKNDYDTNNNNYVENSGSVYVFKNISGKWVQIQKIVSPYRYYLDKFGEALAISDNYAIIGVQGDDRDSSDNNSISSAGAAYLYKLISGRWVFQKKITSKIRSSNDAFGNTVDINDNYIIIGSKGNKTDASNNNTLSSAGSVYVYKNYNGNWYLLQKIVASDRSAGDNFGLKVSLDSNNLMISSEKGYAGRMYYFRLGTKFTETQKFISKDLSIGDDFGISIHLKGDFCIVGAPGEQNDTSGIGTLSDAGAAYIFQNVSGTWKQIKKIVSYERNASDYFGISVAINEGHFLVGAYGEDNDTFGQSFVTGAGAAYFYKLKNNPNWVKSLKVISVDYATNDEFGKAVSIDSNYAIIGAANEDEDYRETNTLLNAGAAYILKKDTAGTWYRVQKLSPNDRSESDNFGNSVAIYGEYAMVSAINNKFDPDYKDTLKNAGAVYVFKNINGYWKQIQKITPNDRSKDDKFGHKIAIFEDYAIISSIYNSKDTNGNPSSAYAGAVYVFKLDSNKWVEIQKITAYDRSVNDFFGFSLDLNKDYAIIGSIYHDLDTAGNNLMNDAGATYIYKKNSGKFDFIQKITSDYRHANMQFGNSVSIDNDIIVVGAFYENIPNGLNGVGGAYIYKLVNGKFKNIKKIIPTNKGEYFQFGSSVKIEDKMIYVTAYRETNILNSVTHTLSGGLYLYKSLDGQTWSNHQKLIASDLYSADLFGLDMDVSNKNILIGSPNSDKDSLNQILSNGGAVYIYKALSCDTSLTRLNINACERYESPSKRYIWSKSGLYFDTISRQGRCDSLLQLNVKIFKTRDTFDINTCNQYLSPSLKYNWNTSGRYRDTLKNILGCDSIMIFDLNISKNSQSFHKYSSCDSFISPSLKYIWSKSGRYYDTLLNFVNCDSIITIDLEVSKKFQNNISLNSCTDIVSPSGKFIWSKSGVYQDTLISKSGCDSILQCMVNIGKHSINKVTISNCNSYLSPSKKYLWENSGTYFDTISNYLSCDSIIEFNLTIIQQSIDTIHINSCRTYYNPYDKKTYNSSTILTDTLKNFLSCDSIIISDLNVTTIDDSVFQNGQTLYSNASQLQYQWLDCNSNYSSIDGEVSQTFSPSLSGVFAVQLKSGDCLDTSACISFTNSSLTSNPFDNYYSIYPNPYNSFLIIQSKITEVHNFNIYDITGKIIYRNTIHEGINTFLLDQFNEGVYILEIINENSIIKIKIIKTE